MFRGNTQPPNTYVRLERQRAPRHIHCVSGCFASRTSTGVRRQRGHDGLSLHSLSRRIHDRAAMEILSLQFASALAAIIVIDLMLQAITRSSSRSRRASCRAPAKGAIVWAWWAPCRRSAMTLIVVWLLQIPGLLLAAACADLDRVPLLLPDPEDASGAHGGNAPTGFWGAMRTIVVADAVMGLDNVLAVAGAAHGSYLLVVLGLVISVPIVVWGSRLLLHWVERYPVIVYFGAAVLAGTAVKMITGEPLAKPVFAANDVLTPLLYMAVIGGVVWAGFVKNHRRLEFGSRPPDALAARRHERELPNPLPEMQCRESCSHMARATTIRHRHVTNEVLKDSAREIHLPQRPHAVVRNVANSATEVPTNLPQKPEGAARPRELLEQHRIPIVPRAKGDKGGLMSRSARRKCDESSDE